MMERIGIIIVLFMYMCPLGQPNLSGEYWISSKSFWDCETAVDPDLCGFSILYFQNDTTFVMFSGVHRINPDTDSIYYRAEPGINKYEGHYSIQKRKIIFIYRQTYGSFFTDTSLVHKELILKKRNRNYFLTGEQEDYEPTKFITDYSKKRIQADIDNIN